MTTHVFVFQKINRDITRFDHNSTHNTLAVPIASWTLFMLQEVCGPPAPASAHFMTSNRTVEVTASPAGVNHLY